jgi:methylglutamate dehydrogenase subunit B
MLHIPCPWCGLRDQTEFTYGGDGRLDRPEPAETTPIPAWVDYIYLRDNPRGPHDELWHHSAGCRQWFQVRRDTATHEIIGSQVPQTTDEETGS